MESSSRAILPEEEELDAKRQQLAELQAKLFDAELELATLQAELHTFERAYLSTVGVRLAELDRIEAEIAEALARKHPKDQAAAAHAEKTRAQAEESKAAFENVEPAEGYPTNFNPSDELRAMYIKVAKAVHPDLTTDENDRLRRHKYMAAANEAYEQGDIKCLKAILQEWQSSPEAVLGEGPAAELIRAIRQISQIRFRIAGVGDQLDSLRKTEIFMLWTQAAEYQAAGRDLLQIIAEEVDAQIEHAKQSLKDFPVAENKR
jgi:hypothetical protein